MKGTFGKLVVLASTLLVGGLLAACGNGSDSGANGDGDKGFVGIAMPPNRQNGGSQMATTW